VAGVHVLSPGQKVSIYREKSATAPAGPAQDDGKASAPVAAAVAVR
jgi:hypothetical protein